MGDEPFDTDVLDSRDYERGIRDLLRRTFRTPIFRYRRNELLLQIKRSYRRQSRANSAKKNIFREEVRYIVLVSTILCY